MLGALYATTLFFSIINATVIQPVIAAERAVSYRERAAGMYSVFPFTLALVSHSCIYSIVPCWGSYNMSSWSAHALPPSYWLLADVLNLSAQGITVSRHQPD